MTVMANEARGRLLQRREALRHALERDPSQACSRAELAETDAALDRIDRGRFGRCEICGGAIGRQRLLALPAARFCIECTATRR
jgi:DnaK suppressor protein